MHLRIFEDARNYLMKDINKFDIIGGIISPTHDGYNKKGLINSTHRLHMCNLAINNSKWISVSDWECKQSQWTKTKEVVKIHYNMLQQSKLHEQEIQILFLCGADLLVAICESDAWNKDDLHQIIKYGGLAVIEREGTDLEMLIDNSELLKPYHDQIHIIPQHIVNNISSTIIRKLIYQRKSAKYLLPCQVLDYIHENQLYYPNTVSIN